MQRCLHLAGRGLGSTSPNPMVGCVIVYEDRIIGEGYHQRAGEPHAEVMALRAVQDKSLLARSTVYVNLEPCSHFGRTPPCAQALIEARVPRVVVGSDDPDPRVSGKGYRMLREAGIQVQSGVLQDECDHLNRRYFTSQQKFRPYIILKWAQSADGFIGRHDARIPITQSAAQRLSHQWRAQEDAIMVGRKTVQVDNPRLTCRLPKGSNPIRVVLDPSGQINPGAHVLNDEAKTIHFTSDSCTNFVNSLRLPLNESGQFAIHTIWQELHKMGIQSVIVEGGFELLTAVQQSQLWDEARIFQGSSVLGGGILAPPKLGTFLERMALGPDQMELWQNPLKPIR